MFRRCGLLLARTVFDFYNDLCIAGRIKRDHAQEQALPVFDRLHTELLQYTEKVKSNTVAKRCTELNPPNRLGLMPSFLVRRMQRRAVDELLASAGNSASSPNFFHPLSRIRGLYVWGGVGCGKTMLMDLLYENAPHGLKKQRIHFHQFMLDVQKTIQDIRYNAQQDGQDAARRREAMGTASPGHRRTVSAEINMFDEVAQRMIRDVELLCFDEVAVSDVANAMLMKRLFQSFYRIGLVVIFTSNRPPEQLYLNGLNRGDFLPFIDLVNKQSVVYDMNSQTDYRLCGRSSNTYLTPFNEENARSFKNLFLECCKGLQAQPRRLQIFGRDVYISRSCGGVCLFFFHEICGDACSSADYQAVAKTFHTVFIDGVPQFSYESTDVKMRFLLLIDSLYERRCKVILYAEVPLELLQAESKDSEINTLEGDAKEGEARLLDAHSFASLSEFERETGKKLIDESDNAFQMLRCISRLREMNTIEYLQSEHSFGELDIADESSSTAQIV